MGPSWPEPAIVPRFVVGVGGYAPLFYGLVNAEVSHVPGLGVQLAGVGSLGVAVPLPLIQPMIGFRGGLGAFVEGDPRVTATAGGHVGLLLRLPAKRVGLRIAVDIDLVVVGQDKDFSPEEAVDLLGLLVPTIAIVF